MREIEREREFGQVKLCYEGSVWTLLWKILFCIIKKKKKKDQSQRIPLTTWIVTTRMTFDKEEHESNLCIKHATNINATRCPWMCSALLRQGKQQMPPSIPHKPQRRLRSESRRIANSSISHHNEEKLVSLRTRWRANRWASKWKALTSNSVKWLLCNTGCCRNVILGKSALKKKKKKDAAKHLVITYTQTIPTLPAGGGRSSALQTSENTSPLHSFTCRVQKVEERFLYSHKSNKESI